MEDSWAGINTIKIVLLLAKKYKKPGSFVTVTAKKKVYLNKHDYNKTKDLRKICMTLKY